MPIGETFVTVPADEGIEPEIERKMKIQKMVIPSDEQFESLIPSSIQKQPPEIRAILTVISPSFRKLDFVINWLHYNNYVARQAEADRLRREGWLPKFTANFGYMILGGVAVSLGDVFIKFIIGHL